MSLRHVVLLLSLWVGGGLSCSAPAEQRPGQLATRRATSTAVVSAGPCSAALVKELYPLDPHPVGPVGGPMPHDLTNVNGTLYFREPAEKGGAVWKSDGTAEGTVRFRERPATLPIPAGGTHLFFEDRVLWKTDGTAAGSTQVRDFHSEPRFVSPGAQLGVNGLLFVFAAEESGRTALWRTDGTAAGTAFLGDFPSAGASSGGLAAVNRTLFFVVDNAGPGRALWKSDGTAQGTAPIKGFPAGDASTALRELVALGDTVYFTAVDETHVRGLWKSDGTAAGTVSIGTFGPAVEDWNAAEPSHLGAVGGTLFFNVRRNGGESLELWKSDGTWAGTAFVRQIPGTSLPEQRVLETVTSAPLGGLHLFVVTNTASGPSHTVTAQLWRSDGTPEGTFVLTEPVLTEPGTPKPRLLDVNGTMLFSARDPRPTPSAELKGQELWMTDGTRAGTALIQDIFPGPHSSYPHQLTLAGPHAFFVATDGHSGFNLWHLPASCVVPLPPPPADSGEPPALRCPADVAIEAMTPDGTLVAYPSALASVDASVRYSHPSGNLFPVGATPVTVTATSPKGGSTSCSFKVMVQDTTAPSILCPAEQWLSGHRGGTVVNYPPALASDSVSTPEVSYSPPSGSVLPVGTTQVVATAKDAVGNTASCTFAVKVQEGVLGCAATPGSAAAWLLLVAAPALLRRRRARQP